VDKIAKEIKKLSPKERFQVKELLGKLIQNKIKGLDIKKLKGSTSIFRARKGNIRIIYRLKEGKIMVLKISRRSEQTYNF